MSIEAVPPKAKIKIRALTYLLQGMDTTLSEDQYKELQALNSYFNWLQNRYDLKTKNTFDITTVTRQHFFDFISDTFDSNNLIKYNVAAAVAS